MLDSLNDTGKTLRRWLGQSQEGVRGYLGVRVRHETNPEHFVGRFVLPCEGGLVVLWDIFQGNEIEPDLFLAFSVGLAAEAGIKFRRYIGNESKEPERQVTQTKGQRKIVS